MSGLRLGCDDRCLSCNRACEWLQPVCFLFLSLRSPWAGPLHIIILFMKHGTVPLMVINSSDPSGLETALYDVSDPSSANYRQHLSKSEVEKFVAPKPESVDAVNAWLNNSGVTAQTLSPAGDWLAIEVPVSKANQMLNANFSLYTHADSGNTAIRTLAYSIPSSLQGHLDFVHPTTTFPVTPPSGPIIVAPPQRRRGRRATSTSSAPDSCATEITPACLQALYNIPTTPATVSSNQLAIGSFSQQFVSSTDVQSFLTQFRPDLASDSGVNTTFAIATLDGGQNNQSQPTVEASLDVQYTVGMATNVPVTFISVGSDNQDGLAGFLDIINSLLADQQPLQCVCSAGLSAYLHPLRLGDGGVSGVQSTNSCTTFLPTFPSGCPFVTSVGATQGVNPETAASFSAGGFSNIFAAPAYQSTAVSGYLSTLGTTNAGLFNATGRAYPDVAAAGSFFQVNIGGKVSPVFGTSASSPTFASLIALINDRLVAAGGATLGFLNPMLYSSGLAALTDITSGSNPGCGTNGFPAATGWDPVTGLGTPDFNKLLAIVS
ncbi:Tripeptidyl-peptidase SED2 [Grifola frondosa]|uniref:Tripeptidyl-peptidase SED2 n=1 Tax=Grifola frondosa TaxID=5627 RepID=A0A1C7LR15_GRIFR|nr:Tripeptidyl-peptidase SED2 [Grifola frondosa]